MLKKRAHKRISLSNIAKHVWMKNQMDDLSKGGQTLPGRMSLHEMVRKDEASAGAFGLGRKKSTTGGIGGVDTASGASNLGGAGRSRVSPKLPSPSPRNGASSEKPPKEAVKDQTFRFGKLNLFGSRRST